MKHRTLLFPGKPVNCNSSLLAISHYGLLWYIVANDFGLLGFPDCSPANLFNIAFGGGGVGRLLTHS